MEKKTVKKEEAKFENEKVEKIIQINRGIDGGNDSAGWTPMSL